jgi:hypothetical protein
LLGAPGQCYWWKWNDGSSITIETKHDSIELSYKITRNGQKEEVFIKVFLSWTSCNYGGKRPWFICPGRGCGKRVAKLYQVGKYFLCRHCHDLVYSSQREGKEFRLLDKAQKIYKRLGVTDRMDLGLKPKPKGMHQTTYDRLVSKAEELDDKALWADCIRFKLYQ